jgi:ATP-binding cassette subfamily F protein 3
MIDFQNVSKRFGTQHVLVEASFRINPGEHVGVVGPNGSGKSTVASLIAGESSPDGGTITLPNDASIGYLHQQVADEHSKTPLLEFSEGGIPALQAIEHEMRDIEDGLTRSLSDSEQASLLEKLGDLQTEFEHKGGYDLRHRTEAALTGLGFRETDFARPIGEFSGGWQMRAGLTRALVANPDILLLDEPSNYLDLPAVEWLQRYLRGFKGTLVLISHDRFLLNSLTGVTIEVANGFAERYAGNYDRYIHEREARMESRIAAQRNHDRKREKAERFVERFRYKATKASQVKSRLKMLERMESVDVPLRIVSRGTIRIPPPARCGLEVARLDDAGVTYDDSTWVLQSVNLRIERGEKIALVGHNGMGKTTLLRLLAGALKPNAGKRVLGHNVVQGYQSQEFADTMNPNQTVFETVKSVAADMREQTVRGLLGGFGFSGDAVEKQVSVLSGGEKVRLAFARLLVNPPNFLLLDEPTTHLDITARETLEEALQQYTGTLCFVSHDVAFVENIATSVIAMRPPGIERFNGDYAYYREKQAAIGSEAQVAGATQRPGVQAPSTGTCGSSPPLDKKALRRQRAQAREAVAAETRELRKTVRRAEQQIETFETEQAKLLGQMADPAPTFDFEDAGRRLKVIQSELAQYTRRWEEASERLEELS